MHFRIKPFKLLVVTSTHSYLTGESCERCLSGWFLFNTSCYFHSKSTANPMNWQDSRADCISRGANLTVINNLEEQVSPVCCRWKTKAQKNRWSYLLSFNAQTVAFFKVSAKYQRDKACKNQVTSSVVGSDGAAVPPSTIIQALIVLQDIA